MLVFFTYELREQENVCIVMHSFDIQAPLGDMQDVLSITEDIKHQIELPKLDSSQTNVQTNSTVSST